MAKTKAYPLLHEVNRTIARVLRTYRGGRGHEAKRRRDIQKNMIYCIADIFGEYEHGTADVKDINNKLSLRMVKEVYEDLIEALGAYVLDENSYRIREPDPDLLLRTALAE